ncbi:MAG: hypothetical protein AAGJ85_08565, partial [Pseudomonadota bacterium]
MRRSFRSLSASLLMGGALISTGCASTATGVKQSALRGGPEVALNQQAPAGTVLAIVRYPAFVDSAAEQDFIRAFGENALGGKPVSGDPVEIGALADSVILKSNYFAMSLYRELAARLPEHSVLLSPHEVTLADDGSL